MTRALDVVEPLAQEVDHPTRLGLLPLGAAQVIRRHLVAPTVLMAGVLLIAVATEVATGAPVSLIGVSVVMVLPTALLALCCATISVTNDPFAYVLSPELGYLQTGLPIALVVVGVGGPILDAREAERHASSAAAVAAADELVVILICLAVIWWLGRRIVSRVTA